MLLSADPGAVGEAACRAEVLDEVAVYCGREGVGWAVCTGRDLLAALTRELAECNGVRLTPKDHEFLELIALWCALRLCGVQRMPDSLTADVESAVRTHVERGFELDGPMTLIRMAHARITQDLTTSCGRLGEAHRPVALLCELSEVLFDAVETLCRLVSTRFLREREQWHSGLVAQRRDLVRGVLRGEPVPVDKATRRLGYDVTQQHLAVLVWSEQDNRRAADLERTAVRLLSRAGCAAKLLIPAGAAGLWAWGAQPSPGAELGGEPLPEAVQAAVGLPAAGLAGLRTSHLQAVTAARIGARTGTSSVHEYRALEFVALLAADESAAASFVARELGPLAADTPSARVLRTTLKSYLDEDRSPSVAARRLHVAKNTVLYRVKKAEQLRGRPLEDNRLQVHAALHLAEVLGTGVSQPVGMAATA
ncbi:PucR family transcriptional regulator [Saccharopolyspora hirsuta]|uniref:PucR family transcriptional regulator n=2 Tax=Saccharopolyspora hirsuta TaxID=1837 RepID=A0A5M7C4R9_SACHI|nr:PucR family transcriptional regulator [Saccharopolyspora hirsuta]